LEAFRILKSARIGQIDVTVVEDARQMGRFVAEQIAAAIRRSPATVLGLCTGGTPIPVYDHLVHLVAERRLSFAAVKTFNLDEYYPMAPADSHSYRYFMDRHLFDFVDIERRNIFLPSGTGPDPHASAARYEELIREAGGIDLQLAGLGHNTHVGFNEPPCDPTSRTRLVTLSAGTRSANARFFKSLDDVPRSSITMGLGTILEARSIILCASGRGKAEAVRTALCGPISPAAPGSYLQQHAQTLAVFDREAASLLELA